MIDRVFEYYILDEPCNTTDNWLRDTLRTTTEVMRESVWGKYDIFLINVDDRQPDGMSDRLVDVGSARFGQLMTLVLNGRARLVPAEYQRGLRHE